MFVSIKGGLLNVQNNFIAHFNYKLQGILRYDVGANKWREWIPYPKGIKICAKAVVLDEKRHILYIFQINIWVPYAMGQTVIVNLTEKTFRTESDELFINKNVVDKDHIYHFYPTVSVMVGDVIYIYHICDKCLKWNVETNQVHAVSGAGFGQLSGTVYCDIQYIHDISIH